MTKFIHRKTLSGFSDTTYPKSYEATNAALLGQDTDGKLTRLPILSFTGVQMRTFHITWLTFFVCFFGWFGLAPLMPIIREDLHLTKSQIGTTIVAAVSMTIVARLLIGRLCDTLGPRLTYTWLLLLGAIPVLSVGLAESYEAFLWFRLGIGVIGASFVITQFHTSAMFADNIKGTANAVAGGWGNLGGGITNMVMPLILAGFVAMGYTKPEAWRLAMLVPGVMLLVMAFVYYRFTQDTPTGKEKGRKGEIGCKLLEHSGRLARLGTVSGLWCLFWHRNYV